MPSLVAAAHELKTPLAVIRQLALSLRDDELSPAEIEQLASRIGLSSERALRLTSDLTRGSRLQAQLFDLEPLDVRPLCQEVIQELQPLYQARGHQLQLSARSTRLPHVIGHRDLLRRVLTNFADNALYYADPSQPVEVSARYRRNDDVVRLGVRDFGPAVRASSLRTKSLQPLAHRPQSSGLGLYISRQFADAMQARVGIVQHRDGASFYIDVPRSSQLRLL